MLRSLEVTVLSIFFTIATFNKDVAAQPAPVFVVCAELTAGHCVPPPPVLNRLPVHVFYSVQCLWPMNFHCCRLISLVWIFMKSIVENLLPTAVFSEGRNLFSGALWDIVICTVRAGKRSREFAFFRRTWERRLKCRALIMGRYSVWRKWNGTIFVYGFKNGFTM